MLTNWSNFQQDIFNAVKNENGSLIIEAVAGSGKTTTIAEAYKLAKGSCIFLAFNKSIATELGKRGLNARTFHSLTFGPVTTFKNNKQIDTDKMRKLIRREFSGNTDYIYGAFICKMVGLAKQAGIGCLIEDTDEAWYEIVERHEIELDKEEADLSEGIDLARKALALSIKDNALDFDDLLYLAVKEGITLPKFDTIFVDEAQDTNAIQRAILRKIMKPSARIIAVGDPAQAIYGFRGADSESMNLIADEFACKRLPLSVSYRCAKAVVRHSQKWVAHIVAADNAPEGEVISMGFNWQPSIFAANDLVLCRTTKPLVEMAYRMLKLRLPVQILGKEIGKGLVALVNKMNAKGIDKLQEKLAAYETRETEKAIAKMQESKAEAIRDKVDAVMFLIEGLGENERTIPALINVINNLFEDKYNCVKLSTIHKAKGLEAEKVYWLNSSQCPAKWAKQDWQKQQEINLCYVATTRAKITLVLIETPKEK